MGQVTGGVNNAPSQDDGYGGKASGPQAPQMATTNPWWRIAQGGMQGLSQGLSGYGSATGNPSGGPPRARNPYFFGYGGQ